MVKSDNIFTTNRSIIVIHTTERNEEKVGKGEEREREREKEITVL